MIVGFTVGGGILLALGIMCLWELIVSLVCFALSRGVLDRCDMPTLSVGK
jgi:hypothetical protein